MATKAKSNSIITAHPDTTAGTITFKVLGVGDIVLSTALLSRGVKDRALYHGLTQRVSDAAAIPFNKEENRYATPQEKFEAMRALVEHYETGTAEWARNRAAGGSRVDGETALILRAVAEHQGKTVDTMRESIKAIAEKREMTPKVYLAGLLATAQAAKGTGPLANIASIYARIKSEQPVPEVKVDADEMLADLGGVGE